MQPPYFNCLERNLQCHDKCRQYQAYKTERQTVSDARKQFNFIDNYFSDTIKRSVKIRRQHA
jgi:hypothetical protein